MKRQTLREVKEIVWQLDGHIYRLKYDDWEEALEEIVFQEHMNYLAFNLLIDKIIQED